MMAWRERNGALRGEDLSCGSIACDVVEVAMSTTDRMPSLFVGHGSPMNAILDNTWSRAFRELGPNLPRPKAILAISAHWFVRGTFVTSQANPPTIHDFGGFPAELYEKKYPAPGSAELVSRVGALLGDHVAPRADWGLDHGTWSVLEYAFPEADVPVVQLSIDATLAPSKHLELGERLRELRDEGVLIFGSGNVTHNLRHAFGSMKSGDTTRPAWAERFDADVKTASEQRDGAALVKMMTTDDGRIAHPTPDHFLPLLYIVGAARDEDDVAHPISGFDLGSISMRATRFG